MTRTPRWRWRVALGGLLLLGVAAAAPSTERAPLAIARLQYDGGGDWYANPSSLPNLIAAVRERTTLAIAPDELRLTGHGTIRLSEEEIERLRAWLERGGFLHVDDNYGLDESFRRELARVFPDRPLVEVPLSHPIYRAVYDFPSGLPKIHEHDGKPPQGLGVFIGERLAVYYSYEADLGNGWEDPGTHPADPPALREAALRMGVNLVVYAVTSRPIS